jgi:hypothetical protein
MADDRLPSFRSASMLAISCLELWPRSSAISCKQFQNSFSRLTLVLRPAMRTERLSIEDFMIAPCRQ